jgi:hypothetical protein
MAVADSESGSGNGGDRRTKWEKHRERRTGNKGHCPFVHRAKPEVNQIKKKFIKNCGLY